jgi:diguanylate cyclase (GGDEF)-like protein
MQIKIILLVALMVTTIGSISYIGFNNIIRLKDKLDTIFYTNLVPIIKLNEILDIYNEKVSLAILKAKTNEVSYKETAQTLKDSYQEVRLKWDNYKDRYDKSDKEYVRITEEQLSKTNRYIKTLSEIYDKEVEENINALSNQNFFDSLTRVKDILKKIIDYEIESADLQIKLAVATYDNMIKNLIVTIAASMIIAMIIAYSLYKNIMMISSRNEMLNRKNDLINQQLRQVAITDPLTKTYNGHYFEEILGKELSRASREKIPVALMLINIDYFKQYNITYGYHVGDIALENVAKIIMAQLKRSSDYLFRLERDEFAVFLYNTNKVDTLYLAELIRREVESMHIPHEESQVSKYLTLSIGVTHITPLNNLEPEELVDETKIQLKKAKAGKRNIVCHKN